MAERLVDTANELDPKTSGKRGARTLQHVTDVFEADLRQRIDDFRRKPQCGQRQRRERCAHLVRRHQTNFGGAKMRRRKGASKRIGGRDMGCKALRGEPRHEIAAERFLAAEEMRTAGDVEREPIGRRETNQRRVTVAPVGDRVQ